MAAGDDQSDLFQPLVAKTGNERDDDTWATSGSGILLRVFSVILIGSISLWANHEASKGFHVIIINDDKDSPLGKKFDLFYRSDDTAMRILLDTSSFVEKFLYDGVPDLHRKPVNLVTLFVSGNNSVRARRIPASSGTRHGEYVISLSSSLMEDRTLGRHIIKSTLQRAMVRVWLWGDDTGAPSQLVNGIAEYIVAAAAGLGDEGSSQPLDPILCGGSHDWWKDKDPEAVAKLLGYCDGRSNGFIRRLNREMRHRWNDRTVEMAFGRARVMST